MGRYGVRQRERCPSPFYWHFSQLPKHWASSGGGDVASAQLCGSGYTLSNKFSSGPICRLLCSLGDSRQTQYINMSSKQVKKKSVI